MIATFTRASRNLEVSVTCGQASNILPTSANRRRKVGGISATVCQCGCPGTRLWQTGSTRWTGSAKQRTVRASRPKPSCCLGCAARAGSTGRALRSPLAPCGRKGGRGPGPSPVDRGKAGAERDSPSTGRAAAWPDARPGQPSRRGRARGRARCGAAGARRARATAPPARQAARRQGRRPPPLRRRWPSARDHAVPRPPRHRAARPPRPAPLEGRAHPRLGSAASTASAPATSAATTSISASTFAPGASSRTGGGKGRVSSA